MRSICADMHDAEGPTLPKCSGYMAERNYEYDFDVDELLSALLESSEFTFPGNPEFGDFNGCTQWLVILTGGPGTGKTTTVRGHPAGCLRHWDWTRCSPRRPAARQNVFPI